VHAGQDCWAISIAPHDIVNAIASKKGRPGQPAPKAKPVAQKIAADFALTLNLKAALVAVGFIVMLEKSKRSRPRRASRGVLRLFSRYAHLCADRRVQAVAR
jgi:hypothetical protein